MQGDLLLILLVLPFVGSILAAVSPTSLRHAEAWLSGGVALAGLGIVIALYPGVSEGGVIHTRLEWLPSYGLDLTLRLDGFAWIFAALITGIGFLVVVYARYYLSPKDPAPRFYCCLLAFMGAMTGTVIAGNLIVLILFWELTSLFSFLLIGYWNQNTAARDGARMALIVTGAGGLCLLGGMLLLGHIAGSYDLDVVLAAGDRIRQHELYLPLLLLVLIGAFAKSAQFPFHFWLPNAMAAPTPVSAYLHSATMVKAGVFLLIRFWPVLGGTDAWFWIVTSAGMTTFLLGAFFALFQHDLKGLLAYSTISHLGLITTLAGLGTPLAIVAAIFHIMNHAIFKASLFMAAGIIDHETGTRDMRRLSGLRRSMPYTATLAIVASAAMAGVPLLNGFLSKEMFFAEAVEAGKGSFLDPLTTWGALLASTFGVAYSLRFIHQVFFGPPPVDLPREPHEPVRWMRLPVEVLVLACLVVGIAPAMTVGPYLHAAALSVLGPATPAYSLELWHGINAPLVMSVVALTVGTAIYALLANRLSSGPEGPPGLRLLKGQRIFERGLVTFWWRWPRALYRLAGTERLQAQLRILVLVALATVAWEVHGSGLLDGVLWTTDLDPIFALFWLVGAACAIGAAWQAKYHRFAALALLGGAGVVTCVTFVWFSATDLAVTQLLVEIVTTVLLLLGLRWLPKRLEAIARGHRMARPAAPRRRPRGGRDLRRRDRRHRACGDDAAAGERDRALLPRELLLRGRRHQRGQRDPGGLPRLRHLRRDHRARDRRRSRSSRCSAASARRARASRRPSSSASRPSRTSAPAARAATRSTTTCACRRWSCSGCSPPSSRSRPTSSCAATTCRAAASRPAWRSRSASCCSTSPPTCAGSRTGCASCPCAGWVRAC